MSAAKTVQGADIGSVFSGDKLFKNLSDKPVIATTAKRSAAGAVTFDVTYLGVSLTRAICKVTDEKQIWLEDRK